MTLKFSVQFTVRNAVEDDLAVCRQLDITYETEYAWQMDVRDEDGSIVTGFRTIRLPRKMRVIYPREALSLEAQQAGLGEVLVAESSGTVCGYLVMRTDTARSSAWISDLAIGRPWRRRKIATGLLQEAYNRAQAQHLQRLMLETQTKNYPGISFCQKNGLIFCGYNDNYYPNHDIALFFGQNIRHE